MMPHGVACDHGVNCTVKCLLSVMLYAHVLGELTIGTSIRLNWVKQYWLIVPQLNEVFTPSCLEYS